MKILDTSVAVDHLRGFPPAVALLRGIVESGEPIAASEIVRFELVAGVREAAQGELDAFLTICSWVPIGAEVARRAGELARRYRGSHGGIDAADYLIGATVELLEGELLTTNIRHFPMLPGLRSPY